ncbi:hypothetical protein [Nitrospira sp. Nam74]
MNFLARLIERHRVDAPSLLPVLEPRLPSRFEPIGSVPVPRMGEMHVTAETPPRPSDLPSRTAWQEAPGPPSPEIQDQSARRPDPRVSAVRSAINAAHATIQMPTPRLTPVAPSAASSLTHEMPTLRRVLNSSPGAGESDDAGGPELRTPPSRRARWLTPSVGPNARVVAPHAKPTDQAAHGNMPSAMPTIHVTIGRVDVRAIMSNTAPPARPTSRSEKNSLEEYLRGRPRANR